MRALAFEVLYRLRRDPWNYRHSLYERGKYQRTLDYLPDHLSGRALEVGCSEGIFTAMLARRVQDLVALDVSSTALRRAQPKNPGVTLVQADIACPRLDLGRFDLIVASEMLYYLPSRDVLGRVSQRLYDWLHPNGQLLLCHRTHRWPWGWGAATVHAPFSQWSWSERKGERNPHFEVLCFRK